MLAITLHQPWATAIAVGAKRFETRSWPTKRRGTIAIHAAKKWTRAMKDTAQGLLSVHAALPRFDGGYPTGAVVAIATLVDVHEMTAQMVSDCRWAAEDRLADESTQDADPKSLSCLRTEFPLGDWAPGRFAWELAEVRPLAKPYPLKGRQGLWALGDDDARAIEALAGEALA